jgi:hypothetical protein
MRRHSSNIFTLPSRRGCDNISIQMPARLADGDKKVRHILISGRTDNNQGRCRLHAVGGALQGGVPLLVNNLDGQEPEQRATL